MAIPPGLRNDSSASDAERVPTIPPPVQVGGDDGVVNAVDPESPDGTEPARRAWRSDSVDAGSAEQRGAEPVNAAQPLVSTRTAIVPVRPSISPVTAAPNVRIAVWHEDLPAEHTLPFVSAPESEIAASFRLLRHRLMKQPGSDVMAVTSAKRGEGKTLCATNLAMAVAEHLDGPVLLVEANLQFPSLARFLNFEPPLCFGEQLKYAFKDPDYEWQVAALASTNLHVLAVDPAVTESQLLSAPAFSRAMKQLASSHYECVIVDCPPVAGSADVNIVADLVGGLLFAARAGVTKKAELRQAAASVEPATILGTVLLPTLKP